MRVRTNSILVLAWGLTVALHGQASSSGEPIPASSVRTLPAGTTTGAQIPTLDDLIRAEDRELAAKIAPPDRAAVAGRELADRDARIRELEVALTASKVTRVDSVRVAAVYSVEGNVRADLVVDGAYRLVHVGDQAGVHRVVRIDVLSGCVTLMASRATATAVPTVAKTRIKTRPSSVEILSTKALVAREDRYCVSESERAVTSVKSASTPVINFGGQAQMMPVAGGMLPGMPVPSIALPPRLPSPVGSSASLPSAGGASAAGVR